MSVRPTRVFEDFKIAWHGVEYVIPSDRVLPAIARVERIITAVELLRQIEDTGAVSMSRLSMAFGSLLRYAGARVTDDEIYSGMFGGEEPQRLILTTIEALLALMIPPGRKQAQAEGNGKMGEAVGRHPGAEESASEKPISRPEAGDSRPSSSGPSTQ